MLLYEYVHTNKKYILYSYTELLLYAYNTRVRTECQREAGNRSRQKTRSQTDRQTQTKAETHTHTNNTRQNTERDQHLTVEDEDALLVAPNQPQNVIIIVVH